MLKMEYLKEYVILAETLNFSKAAERAFITQPALSRHVAALEEEMGARLVERTTRKVRLTLSGEVIYKACKNILETWSGAKEAAIYLAEGQEELLTISSPYYWTEDYTEPVISQFEADHPRCDLRLISCQPHEGFDDLLSHRSDIFLNFYNEETPANIRRVPVANEPLCIVCPDNHPLAEKETISIADLDGVNMVSLGHGSPYYKAHQGFMTKIMAEQGYYPASTNYTQQIDTLGLALKKKNAVSVMPYGVRHMDRSYLRFIPLDDVNYTVPMCLYYLIENTNPLIPAYIQTAKQVLSR